MERTGKCLCGAVAFTAKGIDKDGGTCHCQMCRKSSGASFVTWVTFPLSQFEITDGEPTSYRSSEHSRRVFCPHCGAQLTFWSTQWPSAIDVTVGTLDTPETFRPDHHIFVSSRISWLHLDDGLPEFPEEAPD